MIIKTDEALKLMQLSVDNYDLVNELIPIVQSKVVAYCKNSFLDSAIWVKSENLVIESNTITADIDLEEAGFYEGCDFRISGSKYNDGVYEVESIDGEAITIKNTLLPETDNYITLQRVVFPQDIKIDVVQLLKYYFAKEGKLVKSESLPGGYSVTFKDENEIMKGFNLYRKPYK